MAKKINFAFLKKSVLKKQNISVFFNRVSRPELAMFTHQFAAMIDAGLPLTKSLSVILNEVENIKLKQVLARIIYDIKSGVSLSDAFAKHPKIFSYFFINMIKSGEAAGILPSVLKRLAQHLDKEQELRQKVSSAFAYPVVVSFVAAAVVFFLLIFIIPVFKNVYKSLRISLPLPTLFLINMSSFMVKYWWILLLLLVASFFIFKKISKRKKVIFFIDHFKLFMPVFGKINRKIATARFTRTLASMIAGGVPLIVSLDVSKEAVNNRVALAVIRALKNNVSKGGRLSEILEKQNIFPPLAVQMISTGEESGTLDKMLNKTADFLDEEIDVNLRRLVIKLEPSLTFFLAALVGYIAISIYLPMFDIIRGLSAK